jgi:oligopeptide/dipeptide ABC transporter ATP-binding protein
MLIEVNNLKKYFPISTGLFAKSTSNVKAVDDVSFSIARGETLGLVGESGCGKSTVGRCILKLIELTGGEILFDGKDVINLTKKELKSFRKKIQIIFQDPYSSLNPVITIGGMLKEILKFHKIAEGSQADKRIYELLDIVGLKKYHSKKYPHEFSGGQRQRIVIAKALSVEPEFIVCDEPVSALDVSIQSQILNLLNDLQKEFNLTYLFISHDLSVVEHISNRVCVMYLGKIVEEIESKNIFNASRHPYTKALISAVPVPDPKNKSKRIILSGDIPSPADIPSGCSFHPRCPQAFANCKKISPQLAGTPANKVRCLLYPESYPQS